MKAKLMLPIAVMLLLTAICVVNHKALAQDFNTPFMNEYKAAFLKKG